MTTDKLDIDTRVSCTVCGMIFTDVAASMGHSHSATDIVTAPHKYCGKRGVRCPTELHAYVPTAEDDADTIERVIAKNPSHSINDVLSQIHARWDTKRYSAAYDIWEDKYSDA